MTNVRNQLLALCRKTNEQRMKFGGPAVSLVWWFDERPLSSPGQPDAYNPLSRYAEPIGELLHPPHPSLWKSEFAIGTVYFDPCDSEPEAVGVFRRLAKQIGGFLAELHPELKPMLVATNPDANWRDLTLAWIFRPQFYEGLEDPSWGVVIRDAFGRLSSCIDELLATEDAGVDRPKQACNSDEDNGIVKLIIHHDTQRSFKGDSKAVATKGKTTRKPKSGKSKRYRGPNVTPAEAKIRRERVADWKRWKAANRTVPKPMDRYCDDETAVERPIDCLTLNRYVNWVTQSRSPKRRKRG